MVSFLLSLVALVLGYLFYGKFVAHVFGPNDRPTPAVTKADGVDFIVLPSWKIFMIQFLNIAGTGPIFGAIMGAWYGPVAYLWIVLGCIFAGAMHDYMSGMLSIRHGGAGLPELVGKYLGGTTRKVMLVFSVLLLMMVGVVFVYSPAIILESISGSKMFWIIAIFVYYIIATLLPIDKIIGKVYPLFAISLLFMAAALMIGLIVKMPAIPELWDNLSESNLNANPAWLGAEPFMSKNRCHQWFSCYSEPVDGSLYEVGEVGSPHLLWVNDYRGHRGAHLGHRFYVFLLLWRLARGGFSRGGTTVYCPGCRWRQDLGAVF